MHFSLNLRSEFKSTIIPQTNLHFIFSYLEENKTTLFYMLISSESKNNLKCIKRTNNNKKRQIIFHSSENPNRKQIENEQWTGIKVATQPQTEYRCLRNLTENEITLLLLPGFILSAFYVHTVIANSHYSVTTTTPVDAATWSR